MDNTVAKFEKATPFQFIGITQGTYAYDMLGDLYAPANLLVFTKADLMADLKTLLDIQLQMIKDNLVDADYPNNVLQTATAHEIAEQMSNVAQSSASTFYVLYKD